MANKAEDKVNDQPECGGGISTSYTNLQSSTESGHELRVINCEFLSNIATFRGSGIYLLINKEEPSRCIEISQFYFRGNQVPKECIKDACPSGAVIYFDFDSTTSTSTSQIVDSILNVNDCTFLSYKADNEGGSIVISIINQEPLKLIDVQ